MKRSANVSIGLVKAVAAAALLAGCGSSNKVTQACVDEGMTVVQDQNCWNDERQRATGGGHVYHWYYWTNRSGGTPVIGSHVAGGSTNEAAGAHVSRGGFGSSASSHSSGS